MMNGLPTSVDVSVLVHPDLVVRSLVLADDSVWLHRICVAGCEGPAL